MSVSKLKDVDKIIIIFKIVNILVKLIFPMLIHLPEWLL